MGHGYAEFRPYNHVRCAHPSFQEKTLKPCPFCGWAAVVVTAGVEEDERWVKCTHCGMGRCVGGDDARAEAIRLWNTRAK